jgi:hypothetical protein
MLRKDLEFAVTLELSDQDGRTIELEQPDRFQSEAPGLYHLRIWVPAGRIPDGSYSARILVEMPGTERELISFELVSSNRGIEPNDGDHVTFALVAKDEPTQLSSPDMEASVGRTLS